MLLDGSRIQLCAQQAYQNKSSAKGLLSRWASYPDNCSPGAISVYKLNTIASLTAIGWVACGSWHNLQQSQQWRYSTWPEDISYSLQFMRCCELAALIYQKNALLSEISSYFPSCTLNHASKLVWIIKSLVCGLCSTSAFCILQQWLGRQKE